MFVPISLKIMLKLYVSFPSCRRGTTTLGIPKPMISIRKRGHDYKLLKFKKEFGGIICLPSPTSRSLENYVLFSVRPLWLLDSVL
jgi:hypothetical protein